MPAKLSLPSLPDPSGPDTTYPSHLFRALLLRRLRFPLPLSARVCRRRRILDPLGGHRASCAQAVVWRGRGTLVKNISKFCREAAAGATTNTDLSYFNLDHICRQDDRRIEFMTNGILWCGERNLRATPPLYLLWLHPARLEDAPADTEEQRSRTHAYPKSERAQKFSLPGQARGPCNRGRCRLHPFYQCCRRKCSSLELIFRQTLEPSRLPAPSLRRPWLWLGNATGIQVANPFRPLPSKTVQESETSAVQGGAEEQKKTPHFVMKYIFFFRINFGWMPLYFVEPL